MVQFQNGVCQNNQTSHSNASDTITLNEIVVKASAPLSKIDGDGFLTTVIGTPLQNLGMAKDVLGYIPGISNVNGAIEVIGRGAPVIYINGKKMRNDFELDQLRSDKIKTIKLITSPGAKYSSETNAVIRIETIRELGDGFSLDNRVTVGVSDYLYGNDHLNLNFRNNGFDIFANLQYDNKRKKADILLDQYTRTTTLYQSSVNMKSLSRTQNPGIQVGFNYNTKGNHSWGLYYQNGYTPAKTSSDYSSSFSADNEIPVINNYDQNRNEKSMDNLIDGYYNGKWGKWNADGAMTLLWRKNRLTQTVNNHLDQVNSTFLKNNDRTKGRLLAFEFNLSKEIWKGQLSFGASYTNSDRSEEYINQEGLLPFTDNDIKENNLGIYAQIMQNFGRFSIQFGLRYEYLNNRYYENGNKIASQSRTSNEVLPSAVITLPIKNVMLQMSYIRKYTQPLYSQLSNAIEYINSNLYESGNPQLKPSFRDDVSLNLRWKWLMLNASYSHQTDRIITVCQPYDGNPAITLMRKENSPYELNTVQVIASIVPGLLFNHYYPVLSIGGLGQIYKIPYLDGIKRMNSPMFLIQFNNILMLKNGYRLNANLNYRSNGDSENVKMGSTWQINLGASKSFGFHWEVSLALNDILNTARKNRFTTYSGAMETYMERIINTRSVELSVSYKFNYDKSKYTGKGAGNEEKMRF